MPGRDRPDTSRKMSRLLIVEDDPTISFMLSEILRSEGFEPNAVLEGTHVLEELRSKSYDVVLLDVMLPGLDGITLLRAIREDPSLGGIRVIMLTAKSDDETTWAGWKAGCDYFLPKPFEPDELVAILRRLESSTPSAPSRGDLPVA